MTSSLARGLAAAMVSFALALACGDPDEGESGPVSCEHGTSSACVCEDGSMGTQLCAHDSSGFEACQCGGDEAGTLGTTDDTSASTTMGSSTTMGTSASTTSASTSGTTDASSSEGEASSGSGDTSSSEGPIGSAPVAEIFHPSDGEERTAGTPIPWIGSGTDVEDGELAGSALVWSSDLDGELGQGAMLDAALATLGTHVITLTATDGDGNSGAASIEIDVVAP